MKVHLVKSKEVDAEKYTGIVDLLKAVAGPVEFCYNSEEVIDFDEDELFTNIIRRKDKFEKQERHVYSMLESTKSRIVNFPLERKEASWDTLFSKCRQ